MADRGQLDTSDIPADFEAVKASNPLVERPKQGTSSAYGNKASADDIDALLAALGTSEASYRTNTAGARYSWEYQYDDDDRSAAVDGQSAAIEDTLVMLETEVADLNDSMRKAITAIEIVGEEVALVKDSFEESTHELRDSVAFLSAQMFALSEQLRSIGQQQEDASLL